MNLDELNNQEETATVIIAGEKVTVDPDSNVKETLRELLRARGITSFSIVVNGNVIEDSSALPDEFDGNVIEVHRYMKAGK